jgi:hypothetical protein
LHAWISTMGRSRRCGKFFPAVPKMFDSNGNNVRSQSERNI